eukprot:sb/3477353/
MRGSKSYLVCPEGIKRVPSGTEGQKSHRLPITYVSFQTTVLLTTACALNITKGLWPEGLLVRSNGHLMGSEGWLVCSEGYLVVDISMVKSLGGSTRQLHEETRGSRSC